MGSMTAHEARPVTGLRVVSHGGGVQTTALLVLAAQGRIDYQTFLFANVGDDSEHPHSLRYVREIAMPYAAKHGIDLIELRRWNTRRKEHETIRGRIMREGSLSDLIPVRFARTGAQATRSCTGDFKIRVVGKWLKEHGATAANKATVAVGISADELQRANKSKEQPYEDVVYPLLCVGDPGIGRPLTRTQCKEIIARAGLPVPGKSACYFCPFQRPSQWEEMAHNYPELFEKSAEIEDRMIARKAATGRDPVYLSSALIPLREAFGHGTPQDALPGLDYDQHCDNGWCMT